MASCVWTCNSALKPWPGRNMQLRKNWNLERFWYRDKRRPAMTWVLISCRVCQLNVQGITGKQIWRHESAYCLWKTAETVSEVSRRFRCDREHLVPAYRFFKAMRKCWGSGALGNRKSSCVQGVPGLDIDRTAVVVIGRRVALSRVWWIVSLQKGALVCVSCKRSQCLVIGQCCFWFFDWNTFLTGHSQLLWSFLWITVRNLSKDCSL